MTVAELVALLMAEDQTLEVRVLDGEYLCWNPIATVKRFNVVPKDHWPFGDKDIKAPFVGLNWS